ncbi:exocyst complex component 3-like protein 4 isoform X2 [Alosa sapidissima]|uniref:exocyst complex component 3-like protein 4 isoform X2 n=1 Tax=Alosa sapidissima TaxID=34773 RepID=UPI001C09D9F2|nr:exocyst complex component 3-like protein 4 isoform X2 [Alosa sapidissima]
MHLHAVKSPCREMIREMRACVSRHKLKTSSFNKQLVDCARRGRGWKRVARAHSWRKIFLPDFQPREPPGHRTHTGVRMTMEMKEWDSDVTDSEDSVINGVTHGNNDSVDRKLGMLGSLRASLRSKSPLTKLTQRSKVKSASDLPSVDNNPNNSTHTLPPPSPSLSVGPPLRGLSGFFQKKDGTSGGSPLRSPQSHTRAQSESSVALGDLLMKKGASLRRSLRLGSKRHAPERSANQEPLHCVVEASQSEQSTSRSEVTETVEVRESYVLPEIPPLPLSVMQINKLIELEVLEEAHLNLLSLRREFHQQQEEAGPDASPVELAHLEKDLHLLYGALRTKMAAIVRQSSALPARNKELLVQVARVVQEEERREGGAGGLGGWRDFWRDAVRDGVRDVLQAVHLDTPERNTSWLAVHLGLLGKAIVENLERVKAELQASYPPSFRVFDHYVDACHQVTTEHLQRLMGRVRELKDYYALLDFMTHRYHSERIMGSFSLRPEVKEEQRELRIPEEFHQDIKKQYCRQLQVELRGSLEKVLQLEREEMWEEQLQPRVEEGLFESHIHMDIWTSVQSPVVNARRIDADLEQRVLHTCLSELQLFPRRLEEEFMRWSGSLLDERLWGDYTITYINSFSSLREHMESYKDSSPDQVTQLSIELEGVELRLRHALLQHYMNQTKPLLRRMMTRKWLSTDDDFNQLLKRTQDLREQCTHMGPNHTQAFASAVHLYVVKEYITPLMKNNYSCRNRKNQRAATKLRNQWSQLRELFHEMRSTADWLHPLGDHLSDIIGQKDKSDIKTHLPALVEDYPDISKRHVAAVLFFRGLTHGRERQLILQRVAELKQEGRNAGNAGNTEAHQRSLFSHIPAAATTDCLAHTPLSCFTSLLPHT